MAASIPLAACVRRAALHQPRWRTVAVHRRYMSVRPADTGTVGPSSIPARKKVTIQQLHHLRAAHTPIAMLTAYDYPTARACDAAGVDIVLVGDSLAQVCLGLPSTTRLTLDAMLHHCRAAARGCAHALLVADMPFGSYQAGADDAVRAAVRMVQEGHAEGVKLEGGAEIVETVRRITGAGVPVMAHVGLLPQRHVAMSGYRVQGRDAASARGVFRAAVALQEAGAFAVVTEAIPHRLGEYITSKLSIPTIGIGAGPGTSGQVLVWDDAMSRWHGRKAKFVRRFANVGSVEREGILKYMAAVRDGTFPSVETESYEMPQEEWDAFLEDVGETKNGKADVESLLNPR